MLTCATWSKLKRKKAGKKEAGVRVAPSALPRSPLSVGPCRRAKVREVGAERRLTPGSCESPVTPRNTAWILGGLGSAAVEPSPASRPRAGPRRGGRGGWPDSRRPPRGGRRAWARLAAGVDRVAGEASPRAAGTGLQAAAAGSGKGAGAGRARGGGTAPPGLGASGRGVASDTRRRVRIALSGGRRALWLCGCAAVRASV